MSNLIGTLSSKELDLAVISATKTDQFISVMTGTLAGKVLDWAVTECGDKNNAKVDSFTLGAMSYDQLRELADQHDVEYTKYSTSDDLRAELLEMNDLILPYSTDWYRCGPIIFSEKISVGDPAHFDDFGSKQPYLAVKNFPDEKEGEFVAYGSTPLMAAMRCYVLSKMGPEIQVPVKLLDPMTNVGENVLVQSSIANKRPKP